MSIKDAGKEDFHMPNGESGIKGVKLSDEQQKLTKHIGFIENLRAKIVKLPAYTTAEKNKPANKKNKLTEEQITFSSKIAAFVPMFIQPFMLLFQIGLTRLGLL
jgi:hypothetical protein